VGAELGHQRIVDREPAARLQRVAALGIEVAERATRDRTSQRFAVDASGWHRDEAQDGAAARKNAHGGAPGSIPRARRARRNGEKLSGGGSRAERRRNLAREATHEIVVERRARGEDDRGRARFDELL